MMDVTIVMAPAAMARFFCTEQRSQQWLQVRNVLGKSIVCERTIFLAESSSAEYSK